MSLKYIPVLVLGACFCGACQQNATSTPLSPTPLSPTSTSPIPASPTPVIEITATPQIDPDAEEYAVYNALLEDQFVGDPINQVLIIDHTRVGKRELLENDLAQFQEITTLEPELVASFMERNQDPYPLEPTLEFGMEYQLLSQEEVDELRLLDEASGWELFQERYPQTYGFVYLSRVGFNADFNQALVYISSYYYEMPIKGGYYLMVRQNGRWVVENSFEWIS